MNKADLLELMTAFDRSGLQLLKFKDADSKVELRKGMPAAAPQAVAVAAAAAQIQPEDAGLWVRAPLVGTYYAAPSPEAEPFARVGQRVAQGQPLCLIEAMKTMNEIPAPCDLIVEELAAGNGSLVAFDAPLVRYRHV